MSRDVRIGVTLGDPCGIGPEITAAVIREASPELLRRTVVFGDRAVLARVSSDAAAAVEVVDVGAIAAADLAQDAAPGRPSRRSGAAQIAYLEEAVRAARDGKVGALVTAPINKQVVREAGFSFPGHTEFLADRLGARRVAMMFAGPRLKVALATVHVALREVPEAVTRPRVQASVELLAEALPRDFGVERPRIGVLGLNPHAGESGLFGMEERDVIAPAIVELKTRLAGLADVQGPLVPDAAFRGALSRPGRGARPEEHDALMALYHDQGLIPVKLVDFDDAVNVTLGLPIVRTSPDHGVAYDIAGRGRARPDSFRAALSLADELSRRRARSA